MESGSSPRQVSPPPPQAPPHLPPPPPLNTFQDPITARVKRVKSIWRLFMITNLGIAAYALITPIYKKDPVVEEEKAPKPESLNKKDPIMEEEKAPQPYKTPPEDFDYDQYIDIVPSSESTEPLLPPEPISEHQQKELFQWMLEEKRKIKPKDREHKKKIDEEKAILKQFIRATPARSI